MNALLDRAIGAVLALPSEDQDDIARAMLSLAGEIEIEEEIDPAHLEGVLEGLDQVQNGQFASAAEVEAAFASFRR